MIAYNKNTNKEKELRHMDRDEFDLEEISKSLLKQWEKANKNL